MDVASLRREVEVGGVVLDALLDAYEELDALQAEVREHFELVTMPRGEERPWYASARGDLFFEAEKSPAIARALRQGEES